MKSKASQPNKFVRIISTPVRALSKARDFYVKSMNGYADRITCGHVAAAPGTLQISGLPKSFSARSYNDQELVRASSGRRFGDGVDVDRQMLTRSGSRTGPRAMPPRSTSVAMGRIDEERPCCYFSEDHVDTTNFIAAKNEVNNKYPRSKSHAVSAKRISVF